MHNMKVTALLLFSLQASSAFAEDLTYLCVGEEATGFFYENGSWGRANFDVSDEKLIIRKFKEGDASYHNQAPYTYGVYPLGKSYPSGRCRFDSTRREFICHSNAGRLFFSVRSGRFLSVYSAGYWEGDDNNDNTPHLVRGRCTKI